jgi:hypothetical protein
MKYRSHTQRRTSLTAKNMEHCHKSQGRKAEYSSVGIFEKSSRRVWFRGETA